MDQNKQKKLLGYLCLVMGGLFVLFGAVLFILSNKVNFNAVKVEATIVSFYDITTSDGEKMAMVDLAYRVGNEVVYCTYQTTEPIDEETINMEIYYNKKNPSEILEAGWTFVPLWTVLLGIIILAPGLYFSNIFTFGVEDIEKKLSKKEKKAQRELIEAKKKSLDAVFPLSAGLIFIIFGFVMILVDYRWWDWLFVIAGAIEAIYFLLDMVPAIIKWRRLQSALKYKVEVPQDQMDSEIQEKETEKTTKTVNEIKIAEKSKQ